MKKECELCGDDVEHLWLTHDGHPEGVNRMVCESCVDPEIEEP